jgi:1-acyl-sn-glycerol-3-phosphate acyltransferase
VLTTSHEPAPLVNIVDVHEVGLYKLHKVMWMCQWLYQHIGRIVWRLLIKNKRILLSVEDFRPNRRYVIAANHQTYFDPWMVPASVPFKIWATAGMPRAFVANRFFSYPLVGNALRIVGAFPAREHPTDPFGLAYAERLLDRGHSIIIFPEGGIAKHREKPAFRGVSVLAQQPRVSVIPMHLEWRDKSRWYKGLDMGVGKPFDGSRMTAQQILDLVYDVPVK